MTSVTDIFRSKPLPGLHVTLTLLLSHALIRYGILLLIVADMLLKFGLNLPIIILDFNSIGASKG